ncbi:MAG: YajG family lipoprotein [Pasteurellaceae bacterium]|nr:YajG family lipoprotein [Pasteurellaceae bacterium]
MLIKKRLFATLGFTTLLLSACSSMPSNTLNFSVPLPMNTTFNTANQKATVDVVTKDGRAQSEVSAYTYNGTNLKLAAKPEVVNLFQQIMQQNLNSKGFHLGTANNATANVLVIVKEFYAKVEEGNLRHKITSRAQLEIHVQGAKGNFTKELGSNRTDEGAFGVDNQDVQKALTAVLKEVTSALYQDQEIGNAISQYSN